ncbi:fimbrial biogenesis outer membrane usher protein [Lysobacter soli]|nr:fimbria/pilus outer membrane usher protein [Lysobacter soli]UTA55127.1 fimbrial biogenesis outer membrane usher protein [Lysobacter soli]
MSSNTLHRAGARAHRPMQRRPIARHISMALLALPAMAAAAPEPSPNPAPDPSPAPASQVEFNVAALGASGVHYDLSRFERANAMLPGEQRVDVIVNQLPVSRESVNFRANDGGVVEPCFTRDLLGVIGVDTGKLEEAGADLASSCLDLRALIPDATWSVDANELRLDVSIPQIALRRDAAGYVDPKLWDNGINAFTLGYAINASQTRRQDGPTYTGGYLGLDAGLNLGGWRIRNQSGYRWNDSGDNEFQNIRTYAEHDIDRWTAKLTVGDTFTTGDIFDTTAFRGINLATDDRMRPDSVNGYAPVVRGTADTNATVEVRQSGYVVYQTTVAPGAFEITDLGATGFGGDLEVTVTEADGRKHSFTVPFAAMPQLMRPGVSRFSLTAGELRQSNFSYTPRFAEGTYQRGINNWLTAYTGAQLAGDGLYRSLAVGGAFNTPVGAVALDITGSRARFRSSGDDLNGYSTRVTYSKNVPSTATTFALAAYRYSSSGFLSMYDAALANDDLLAGRREHIFEGEGTTRSRLQLTVNQRMGSMGDFYVVGSRNDYWDGAPIDNTYQIGWNKRFRNVSLGLNASRSRLGDGQSDDRYFVNLIMPLGTPTPRRAPPTLSLNATHGSEGNRMRAGVGGVVGDNRQVSYGVSGDFGDNKRQHRRQRELGAPVCDGRRRVHLRHRQPVGIGIGARRAGRAPWWDHAGLATRGHHRLGRSQGRERRASVRRRQPYRPSRLRHHQQPAPVPPQRSRDRSQGRVCQRRIRRNERQGRAAQRGSGAGHVRDADGRGLCSACASRRRHGATFWRGSGGRRRRRRGLHRPVEPGLRTSRQWRGHASQRTTRRDRLELHVGMEARSGRRSGGRAPSW